MSKLATKPDQEAPDLLTPKEVCARLRCHPATLQRWVINGELNPIRIGKKFRRFKLSDIQRLEREGSK